MSPMTLLRTEAVRLTDLVGAGGRGLLLRNPDNGRVFRVVYVNWQGVLPGVRLFRLGCRREDRSPIMSDADIAAWLGTIELVRDGDGVFRIDGGQTPLTVAVEAVGPAGFAVVTARVAADPSTLAGIALIEPGARLVQYVGTSAAVRRRGVATAMVTAAVEAFGVLRYGRSAPVAVVSVCEALGLAGI